MDQDCDLTPVACELGRIADFLDQGPSWLDITSGLVLPVLIALATLWVALYASGIAKQTNALTKEMETQRIVREDRAARRAVVPELQEWATWVVFFREGEGGELKGPAVVKLREHEQRLGETTMGELRAWVIDRAKKRHDLAEDDPKRESIADVYQDLSAVISAWADDPASLQRRRKADLTKEILDEVFGDESERTEHAKRIAEQLADLDRDS